MSSEAKNNCDQMNILLDQQESLSLLLFFVIFPFVIFYSFVNIFCSWFSWVLDRSKIPVCMQLLIHKNTTTCRQCNSMTRYGSMDILLSYFMLIFCQNTPNIDLRSCFSFLNEIFVLPSSINSIKYVLYLCIHSFIPVNGYRKWHCCHYI